MGLSARTGMKNGARWRSVFCERWLYTYTIVATLYVNGVSFIYIQGSD